MMAVSLDIHDVVSVRAVELHEARNIITIEVVTKGGTSTHHLYFGDHPDSSSRAAELFYALGGSPENVAGGV